MPRCSVFHCKKNSRTSNVAKDGITFHLFPKDFRREIWRKACGNHATWIPKRTSTICSEHFDKSLFVHRARDKRKLNDGAIPTLKLSEDTFTIEEPPAKQSREDLIEPRKVYIVEQPEPQPELPQLLKTSDTAPSISESTVVPDPKKPSSITYNIILQDTPRNKKLKLKLKQKDTQIKRLHSQVRFLKRKVESLEELLNNLS